MNIKQINQIYQKKQYQKAAIKYAEYITTNPTMTEYIIEGLKLASKKIISNKISKKEATSIQPATLAFTLPWAQPIPKEESLNPSWWRIDYVVHDAKNSHGTLSLVVAHGQKEPITLEVPFEINKHRYLVIMSPASAESMDEYQATYSTDQFKITYCATQLTASELYSQLLLNETGSIEEFTNKASTQPAIDLEKYTHPFTQKNSSKIELKNYVQKITDSIQKSLIKNKQGTLLDERAPIQLTPHKNALGTGVNLHIEGVKCISKIRVIYGWIIDPDKNIQSITYKNPSGQSIEIHKNSVKFARPDVITAFKAENATTDTHYGFAISITDTSLPETPGEIDLLIKSNNGLTYKESIQEKSVEKNENGLKEILGVLPSDQINALRCESFFKPIFNSFITKEFEVNELFIKSYPTQNTHPIEISIIIPLYGDTRFELTQIPTLAALKPENWEVIFAIDDPKILSTAKNNIHRLSKLYDLNLKVVAPDKNLGFSGINNFAVKHSTGKYILFLNSDCFITDKTLITDALNWFKNNRDAGAAGFRLEYADNTIQHDGMSTTTWNESTSFYLNDHPRLGTPTELVPSHIDNDPATLLTAACLLMPRELFDKLKGYDTCYYRGDFEDSDLCLKILAAGYKLGIVRKHGIFHLERQSIGTQEGGLRQKITLTNSYIYSQRWKTTLKNKLQPLEVIA